MGTKLSISVFIEHISVLINTNLTLDFIIQIFHTSIKATYPHAQFEVAVVLGFLIATSFPTVLAQNIYSPKPSLCHLLCSPFVYQMCSRQTRLSELTCQSENL